MTFRENQIPVLVKKICLLFLFFLLLTSQRSNASTNDSDIVFISELAISVTSSSPAFPEGTPSEETYRDVLDTTRNVSTRTESELNLSRFCSSDFFVMADSGCAPPAITAVTTDSIKAPSTPKHKRLIAAILSFPLPFGIFGGHRIYFGTKPYIPFVYIATLGGCLGILPLIDFIAILISDDETFDRFKNNPGVFMWSK